MRRSIARRGAWNRILDRVGVGRSWGREPVVIDDLVSPLRYDILIRQRYFEFLEGHHQLYERDLPHLAELSRALPYYTWYATVVIPRYSPELRDRPDLIEQAFERRVAASAELYRSFERRGYDPAFPITLRTGREITPTETGKALARRIYAGDGCHRLALVRARGTTVLEPGTYVLKRDRRFTPLDNTSLLLRALSVDGASYREFLALSYGDRPDPERAAEMRHVAEIDAALLVSPSAASLDGDR